ncbi:poly(A)-binding protein binding protein [Saxophila tyrrhenica]|uniref:Poly(A)-binding protein binding protein n=1 Tax=Saxophila tyrrhenica TaxID=1690608 RepID=A0AAV9PH80_9PEZI|nr:poly(A)-binding protein binding protein [Saxophila tyrrhenica]
MSAAAMSGSDAVKATSSTQPAASSKPQAKSNSSSGKAMDGARKQTASPVDGQNRKQSTPQPRAWQGTNPITQRASTSTPNGTHASTPKPQTPSQLKSTADSNTEKLMQDRALFLLANCVSHDATVTLKNGEQYTGVFTGGSFESNKQQYVLKMVRRTHTPQQVNGNVDATSEYLGEGEEHKMIFDKEDTVDLHVPGVQLNAAQPVQNGSIGSSFRTDTEISARDSSQPRERELQRWDAGADSNIDMSLEASGETGWDQFAANERMYGVSSTYDENIYTTQINRDDPRYRQREAEAARIAREIEGSAPSNAHVAEERRRDAERGEGLDEEEKYSGVQRETSALPKRATGAYVPPSQRPLTNLPTVPGAPYDPAIISLAKPSPAPTQQTAATAQQTPKNASGLRTPDSTSQVTSQTSSSRNVTDGSQSAAKATETTAEDHVRNVKDQFKRFANDEKLKAKNAQEMRKMGMKADKEVKLNDLRKFAQMFTLKSEVPDDLVPILAKDREKQIEIQQKAKQAAEDDAARRSEREKRKAASATSPAQSSAASQSAATAPQASTATSQAGTSFTQPAPSRTRAAPNMRIPQFSGPMQSQQRPGNSQQGRPYGRNGIPAPQPLPADLRIPPPRAAAPVDAGPLSPSKGLNAGAKAFEFRPAASTFTPTGVSPSPQRSQGKVSPAVTETADFFQGKKPAGRKSKKGPSEATNPLKRMLKAEHPEELKKAFTTNGGIPQPYRTPPTWPFEEAHMNMSYQDSIPKPPSQTHSQMHTPSQSTSQMPHAHQMQPHMHGQPPTPSQRPPFLPPPHHSHPQGYGPGMPHFGPNGSVQNSPRFQHQQMAFNGQMQGMPMPQFAGQQMQGYQMSPSMQYRQMNMPPNGPMMMHPQNQSKSRHPHDRDAVTNDTSVPGHQGFQRGGPPQGYNQQMMPGTMPNQPHGGNFMPGAPMPGQHPGHNPQQQNFSPMPPHAQPQMHPGGYAGSPRPSGHMMQHASSHQGFQPQHNMGGMMGGGMNMNMGQMGPGGQQPGPPHFPGPGVPHPYHLQHRQMSQGAYPQMTPRGGHAAPAMGPSPGHGGGAMGGQGDEGK